jgi:UrcA family protein
MLNKTHVWLNASLTAIALSANVAQADVRTGIAPSVSVVYSQKDLTSTHGVQTLYARLKNAARQVCPDLDVRDLARAAPARLCYESALARAVEGVRKPELTTLHLQSGHRSAG